MKSLEDRMKRYEAVTDYMLPNRMPIFLRLDGWHFKSFTKGWEKPFDLIFHEAMVDTMLHLCKELPGTVLGYTQSDEITLLLCDYENIDSEPWFDNRVNKLLSIPSGIAAVKFNSAFKKYADSILDETEHNVYAKKFDTAIFDARAFVVPENDVANCFYWRQRDAIRNSIESVGQTYIGKNNLHKMSNLKILEALKGMGIIWDDYDTWLIRGACTIKKFNEEKKRMLWEIDRNIPIFKDEGREYITKVIPVV